MTTPGYDTFPSIPALKAACRAVDNKFFTKGAMEFFRSKIETGIIGGVYFVTSEQFDDETPRLYTVRKAERQENGRLSIETVGEFQAHATLAEAKAAIFAEQQPNKPLTLDKAPDTESVDTASEEYRVSNAQRLGREQAEYEKSNGHTVPRSWEKDGDPHAGAYSHLTAAGYTKLGSRMYALPFIDAYRAAFPAHADAQEGKTP